VVVKTRSVRSNYKRELETGVEEGIENAPVMFAIGRALKGWIDLEKRQIFGFDRNFEECVGLASHASKFYEHQLAQYRRAVDCWMLVGKDCGLVKDVRIIIAKLIWEAREEAEYSFRKPANFQVTHNAM
jgi:hypothetical protein